MILDYWLITNELVILLNFDWGFQSISQSKFQRASFLGESGLTKSFRKRSSMLFSNFLNFLLKRTVPSLDLFLRAFWPTGGTPWGIHVEIQVVFHPNRLGLHYPLIQKYLKFSNSDFFRFLFFFFFIFSRTFSPQNDFFEPIQSVYTPRAHGRLPIENGGFRAGFHSGDALSPFSINEPSGTYFSLFFRQIMRPLCWANTRISVAVSPLFSLLNDDVF